MGWQQPGAASGERTRHCQPTPYLGHFISGSFATNAIGTLTIDAATVGNTLYAGTGEPNASADSEAGFGIYKSTDGGDTWTHLAANTSVPTGSGVDCTCAVGHGGMRTAPAYSGPAFDGRAISSIIIDPNNPNTIYVGSVRAARGISSVLSGGVVTSAPGLPPYGFWKSTDGGANFTLLNYQDVCLNPDLPGDAGIIQASFGSTRGVHAVALDPGSASSQSTLLRSRRTMSAPTTLMEGSGVRAIAALVGRRLRTRSTATQNYRSSRRSLSHRSQVDLRECTSEMETPGRTRRSCTATDDAVDATTQVSLT